MQRLIKPAEGMQGVARAVAAEDFRGGCRSRRKEQQPGWQVVETAVLGLSPGSAATQGGGASAPTNTLACSLKESVERQWGGEPGGGPGEVRGGTTSHTQSCTWPRLKCGPGSLAASHGAA